MAESVSNTGSDNNDKDEELEELLNSALEDFNKPTDTKELVHNTNVETDKDKTDDPSWNDEFLLEAQKHFEKNMKDLFGQGEAGANFSAEGFEEQLRKMADEANKVLTEQSRDPEFSATIAQTLKNLSENTEKMQSELGQEALAAMMGSLGLGSEASGGGDIMPFMQSMMQSFLSKDVLYPSLKDITEKYPVWIEENKNTLPEADYDNYNKQFNLMKDVCVEYEKETETDSEETKKKRFMKILGLMEEIQKLGHPPKDLVSDEGSPLAYDENGVPNCIPGMDPNQCCLM